jgi:hypothetical protein
MLNIQITYKARYLQLQIKNHLGGFIDNTLTQQCKLLLINAFLLPGE